MGTFHPRSYAPGLLMPLRLKLSLRPKAQYNEDEQTQISALLKAQRQIHILTRMFMAAQQMLCTGHQLSKGHLSMIIPKDSGLVGKGIAEIWLEEHPPQEPTYHLPACLGPKPCRSGAVPSQPAKAFFP